MRDYLALWEIEEIVEEVQNDLKVRIEQIRDEVDSNGHVKLSMLEDILFNYKCIYREVETIAETCLCAAHSVDECVCGAWE